MPKGRARNDDPESCLCPPQVTELSDPRRLSPPMVAAERDDMLWGLSVAMGVVLGYDLFVQPIREFWRRYRILKVAVIVLMV